MTSSKFHYRWNDKIGNRKYNKRSRKNGKEKSHVQIIVQSVFSTRTPPAAYGRGVVFVRENPGWHMSLSRTCDLIG